jgi:hypothetical protein
MMDRFVLDISSYRNRAGHLLSTEVRVGGACDLIGGEEGFKGSYVRCQVKLDGQPYKLVTGPDFDRADAKVKPVRDALAATVAAQQAEFLAKIDKPLRSTIAAYDAMCRKAKSSYAAPREAGIAA